MTNRSAPTSRASSWLARSLSITASTPTRVRSPSGRYMVGTPPPPAQITTTSLSSSQRMGRISKIRLGSGEGTTRRQRSPSGLNTHPFSPASWSACALVVDRTDELRRIVERRVRRVDLDHRQDGRERHLDGQEVAELLLEDVADHALGLGAQHVQGVGLDLGVGGGLERQQPHLGPVAVRQDQLVLARHRRQRRGGRLHVAPLRLGGHRLAPLQQRVAAQGHDHSHRGSPITRQGWPPSRP